MVFLLMLTMVTGSMRIVLLLLMLLAVVLIVTGGTVALVTLYNQRKAIRSALTELESEST